MFRYVCRNLGQRGLKFMIWQLCSLISDVFSKNGPPLYISSWYSISVTCSFSCGTHSLFRVNISCSSCASYLPAKVNVLTRHHRDWICLLSCKFMWLGQQNIFCSERFFIYQDLKYSSYLMTTYTYTSKHIISLPLCKKYYFITPERSVNNFKQTLLHTYCTYNYCGPVKGKLNLWNAKRIRHAQRIILP